MAYDIGSSSTRPFQGGYLDTIRPSPLPHRRRAGLNDHDSHHLSIPPPNYARQVPCPVCKDWTCSLPTHRAFARDQLNQPHRISYKKPAHQAQVAPLINSAFPLSYAFNPLHPVRYTELGASTLGVSDDIPSLEDTGHEMHNALHTLLSRDVAHNVAFHDPSASPFDETTSKWLMTASTDGLTVTSILAMWSLLENGWNPNPKIANFSLKIQGHLMTLLRDCIQSDGSRTSSPGSILFAAASQLQCVNYFGKDDHDQRHRLMDGLEELVKSHGGFRALQTLSSDGVVQNLLWADSQVSFLNAAAPRFWILDAPSLPYSLRSYDFGDIHAGYWRCTSPDILAIVKSMRMILMFRRGSLYQPSSTEEYKYLISLFRYTDVQLCLLQARYHRTATASECVILTLCLMRVGSVTRWRHHSRLAKAVLARLETALEIGLKPWIDYESLGCLTWVCIIAVISSGNGNRRHIFLQRLFHCVDRDIGDDAAMTNDSLHAYFGQHFHPLLWHPDMTGAIDSICTDLLLLGRHFKKKKIQQTGSRADGGS